MFNRMFGCNTTINIHYEGHFIRYFKSQCDIDNSNTGNVLLGDLEKVGWVVLKYDYEITNGGEQQDYFYQIRHKLQCYNLISC